MEMVFFSLARSIHASIHASIHIPRQKKEKKKDLKHATSFYILHSHSYLSNQASPQIKPNSLILPKR